MPSGHKRADLSAIRGGYDVPWGADCQGCDWTRPPLIKSNAVRQARLHLAANPTHRVALHATVMQMVYGAQGR